VKTSPGEEVEPSPLLGSTFMIPEDILKKPPFKTIFPLTFRVPPEIDRVPVEVRVLLSPPALPIVKFPPPVTVSDPVKFIVMLLVL